MNSTVTGTIPFCPDPRSPIDEVIFLQTLSERYSYRLLLLPNVKNNPNRDSLAIEFVKSEPGKEDEFAKTVILLKERRVPVVNEGGLKPSDVVNRVNAKLQAPRKLSLNLHARCWKYFQVRPASGAHELWSTKGEYCRYDAVHKDYVYTDAWAGFLIGEFAKPGRFDEVVRGSSTAKPSQGRDSTAVGIPVGATPPPTRA